MNLPTNTYHFEFLTPAWAGGASPAETAEVRIATLRGHLRQWLRLLYPGQRMDEEIFGRLAGEGRNAQAASSRVLLQLEKPVQSVITKNLVGYTGRRDERDALQDPESYFLWPLRTQSRGVLMPGAATDFTLRVRWYPSPVNRINRPESKLGNAIQALGLLGNIGTRATRGYGSLWEKGRDFANEDQLREALHFLPNTIQVRLLDGSFDDVRRALAAAARWMRSYRVGSATYGTTTPEAVNDHDVADPAQTASVQAVVYRHALGMPLSQRFNRGRDTSTVQSKHRHDGTETDRYPSPLRIKVIRMGGKCRVLVVLLRGLLLPVGTRITLSNRPTRTAELRHDLLNQMMASGLARSHECSLPSPA
ncbi:MAG: hypothetical protein JNM65_01600 [Verrucomicrobiaceae bacterium]|nr:hypothetical protein [Verrucomicrobiaceae bacterium]